jgi:organic hydroperoxide reductase OsmC/OhrA
MSEHAVQVSWSRGERPADAGYARDHAWELPGGARVPVSAAAEYGGSAALLNPEQALVGALASCHMLSFLALAARRGWVVEAYSDAALGVLERNAHGQLAVTRVQLRPAVRFAQPAPAREEQEQLHRGAHRGCFIAHSVRTEVEILPRELADGA